MMHRPNLARRPFLDTRPVVVASAAMAVLAVSLTVLSVVDFVSHRGQETQLASSVDQLEGRRKALAAEVAKTDYELARAPWKKLKTETASMRQVVVLRRNVWGSLFADLERVIPWDTRLTGIVPQAGENGEILVGLSGVAADRAAWLKLVNRLFTDGRFSDPMPLTEELPGEQNPVGFRFTLQVRYWPEGRS